MVFVDLDIIAIFGLDLEIFQAIVQLSRQLETNFRTM